MRQPLCILTRRFLLAWLLWLLPMTVGAINWTQVPPILGVDYAFSITTAPVSSADYVVFLNAKAKTDTFNLYSNTMTGIRRRGRVGSYSYVVRRSSAGEPVVFANAISRELALRRFANWLHNGQGTGSTETGAYTMTAGPAASRNVGALFFLPSVAELQRANIPIPGPQSAHLGAVAAPAIVEQPVSKIVGIGEDAVFGVYPYDPLTDLAAQRPEYMGREVTIQWLKAGRVINRPGANFLFDNLTGTNLPPPDFRFKVTGFGDVGAYSARLTNPVGTVTTVQVNLIVVDKTTEVMHNHIEGQTARITVSAAGAITRYEWFRVNGLPFDTTRVSGINSKTLVISRLEPWDVGGYVCQVRGIDVSCDCFSAVQTVYLVTETPQVTPGLKFGDATVGGDYKTRVTVEPGDQRIPARYSATGLPRGMRINSLTGEITGYPTDALTAPRTYLVLVRATNAMGDSLTEEVPLTVNPLPANAVGSFSGPVDPHASLNDNLGGRVDFTSTTAGGYSGTVTMGGVRYSFRGGRLNIRAGVNDAKVIEISRGPTLTPLIMTWNVNLADGSVAGTFSDGVDTCNFGGWRNAWLAAGTEVALAGYSGYYTSYLKTRAVVRGDIPEGYGYATVTISAKGSVRITGKLADGTAFSIASTLGPNGEILVFQALYRSLGSIFGSWLITPGAGGNMMENTLGSTLRWHKKQQPANVVNYPRPFTEPLEVFGRKYNPVAPGANILGNNVTDDVYRFRFYGVGWDPGNLEPDANFALSATNQVTVPTRPINFAGTTLTFNIKTGVFDGRFGQTDSRDTDGRTISQSVTHCGVVLRDSQGNGAGFGNFLLVLPARGGGFGYFTFPEQSPLSVFARMSGRVEIGRAP